MACPSVRRLARRGCDFPGFIHRNWPLLLRQLYHHYERERTGNFGTGGDRRICMEVKRVVSLEMVTSLTSRSTSRIVKTVLFSLLPCCFVLCSVR